MTIRSVVHVEARHTRDPHQLLRDLAGTVARTGALLHETAGACIVLSPEHAQLLARHGMGKREVRELVHEHATVSTAALEAVGKEALSSKTRLRVPADHPDALAESPLPRDRRLQVLASPRSVVVVVAGAANSGVSAVVDLFGPGRDRASTSAVQDPPVR